jgi:Flp pilus assembly protein TadD
MIGRNSLFTQTQRQRTAALQDAAAILNDAPNARSVLECGSPLPLSTRKDGRALVMFPIILAAVFTATVVHCEPFLPKDGGQVLETLRTTAFDPVDHEIRELRARLTAEPTNLTLACQFARRCIERGRSQADPRYLGRAQAALVPWWDLPTPPVDALVLRATIKQSQHDFTNALADLNLASHLSPRNPQVWLTRSTILTVLGDYAGARKACGPLARLAPGLVALTAVASVTCLNGEAEQSCALLKNGLDGNSSASVDEKIWATTILAEALERLGRVSEAETEFKKAMSLGQRDPYLLGAYADLLLDQGRAKEAAELLKNENRADGLLLRLTLAESEIVPRPATCNAHIAALKARFEAGHLRGDFVHQREEARFELRLMGQSSEALRLAKANWQIQHEPADLRILMESAVEARDAHAAEPAVDFMRTNRLEDVELAKLAGQLNEQGKTLQ